MGDFLCISAIGIISAIQSSTEYLADPDDADLANIIIHGKDILESREYAMRLAKKENLTYINGYDHPHIIAGQGTMGLEIVEQVKNIDAVVVPVGGGGLIAGIALAVKSLYPHIQVIGVESERCASFRAAMEAGQPVYTAAKSTLADGLAVPK